MGKKAVASSARATIVGMTRTGLSRPTSSVAVTEPPWPGDNSAQTPPINTTAYKATSARVRESPRVSGTLSGQAGNLIVLGRNQYRTPPIGGMNRPVSGPDPQPRPRTSNSRVKTMTFWSSTNLREWSFTRPRAIGPELLPMRCYTIAEKLSTTAGTGRESSIGSIRIPRACLRRRSVPKAFGK